MHMLTNAHLCIPYAHADAQHMYLRVYMHTYIHTRIHTRVHTHTSRSYINAHIHLHSTLTTTNAVHEETKGSNVVPSLQQTQHAHTKYTPGKELHIHPPEPLPQMPIKWFDVVCIDGFSLSSHCYYSCLFSLPLFSPLPLSHSLLVAVSKKTRIQAYIPEANARLHEEWTKLGEATPGSFKNRIHTYGVMMLEVGTV